MTDAVAIERSLFICFVPRAGSLYLAGLVASTEVAGIPVEAFHSPLETNSRRIFGIETDEEYFQWIRDNYFTSNGSFGCKLTFPALQVVLRRLRLMHGDGLPDVPLLARAFPNPVFVWLRRRDVVAQAVSWARALQTGQWISSQTERGEPVYDFDLIEDRPRTIRAEEGKWSDWFARNGIAATEVVYEDVLADPRGEVERVLAPLGVELPAGVELRPYEGEARQGDGLNAEWARRYRADLFERQWLPGAALLRPASLWLSERSS
jgi:LPS sulfotransferase NodH